MGRREALSPYSVVKWVVRYARQGAQVKTLLAGFAFFQYFVFPGFLRKHGYSNQAVLGDAASGAGVSGDTRDGGALDRPGPPQGPSHAHGAPPRRVHRSGGVSQGARYAGAAGAGVERA